MPRQFFITATRRRKAVVAAGIIVTATLALGSFSGTARADWRDRDRHDRHHGYWAREHNRYEWGRGRYEAPPVVYGRPYYAPPVVYGSPYGLNVHIH